MCSSYRWDIVPDLLATVVKNPLSPVEHPGGAGVNNELFEESLEQFVVCLFSATVCACIGFVRFSDLWGFLTYFSRLEFCHNMA